MALPIATRLRTILDNEMDPDDPFDDIHRFGLDEPAAAKAASDMARANPEGFGLVSGAIDRLALSLRTLAKSDPESAGELLESALRNSDALLPGLGDFVAHRIGARRSLDIASGELRSSLPKPD